MTIGTEHEFSINDPQFNPLPVSDTILKTICGSYSERDPVRGRETRKGTPEDRPRDDPPQPLLIASRCWKGSSMRGIQKFSHVFRDRYQLLGLGMHPTLNLERDRGLGP